MNTKVGKRGRERVEHLVRNIFNKNVSTIGKYEEQLMEQSKFDTVYKLKDTTKKY